MTDRERPLYDLLADELADDWQPLSINVNRLSCRERQQLKDGPDATFITKKLDEARHGQKRTYITAGVGIALPFLFAFVPFDLVASGWETLASVLWIATAFGLASLGALRHMHWCKRAVIYRAFRLMDAGHEPEIASDPGKSSVPA